MVFKQKKMSLEHIICSRYIASFYRLLKTIKVLQGGVKMEEAITKAKLKANFGIGIIIRTMRVKFLQLQQSLCQILIVSKWQNLWPWDGVLKSYNKAPTLHYTYFDGIIKDCIQLMHSFSSLGVQWVRRNCNIIANKLASLAFMLQERYWIKEVSP